MAVVSGYQFKLLDCQLDANPNVQVYQLNDEFKYVPRRNEVLGHLDLLKRKRDFCIACVFTNLRCLVRES